MKMIIRIMTFSKFNEESKPVLLNTYELNTYFIALFMFSYFDGTLPAIFEDYFAKNKHLNNYNTRSVSNIHINYQRSNYGIFSLKYRGAKLLEQCT